MTKACNLGEGPRGQSLQWFKPATLHGSGERVLGVAVTIGLNPSQATVTEAWFLCQHLSHRLQSHPLEPTTRLYCCPVHMEAYRTISNISFCSWSLQHGVQTRPAGAAGSPFCLLQQRPLAAGCGETPGHRPCGVAHVPGLADCSLELLLFLFL